MPVLSGSYSDNNALRLITNESAQTAAIAQSVKRIVREDEGVGSSLAAPDIYKHLVDSGYSQEMSCPHHVPTTMWTWTDALAFR